MTAMNYWKLKFDEYPQNDSERLAVVMMAEYGIEMWNAALDAAAKKIGIMSAHCGGFEESVLKLKK
jgi:hypothetical protein